MIKNVRLRITADRRGFISCGRLVNDKPVKLDHFDVADFPEIAAVYGDKPPELLIYLPASDPATIFDSEYNLWGGSKDRQVKKRSCDGVECIHRIEETVAGTCYAQGEASPCVCEGLTSEDKQHCKYSAYLKVLVGHPMTRSLLSPQVYLLRTHSINSGETIWSELIKMYEITRQVWGEARLTGFPFMLSIQMTRKKDNVGITFPLIHLQALSFETPRLLLEGASLKQAGLLPPGLAEPEKVKEEASYITDEELEKLRLSWKQGRLKDELLETFNAKFQVMRPSLLPASQLEAALKWIEGHSIHRRTEVISPAQVTRLWAIARENDIDEDLVHALLARFGFSSAKAITIDRYDAICNELDMSRQRITTEESAEIIEERRDDQREFADDRDAQMGRRLQTAADE